MDEMQVIQAHLPESVKEAITTYQTHKLASVVTGLDEFSIEKIAAFLGGRIAARHMRWRPVAEGLLALNSLKD